MNSLYGLLKGTSYYLVTNIVAT